MKPTLKIIKRIREDHNMSREEMANQLNMSLSGYAKIERGEVELTITRLAQIGDIVGYTATELIEMGESNTLSVPRRSSPTSGESVNGKPSTAVSDKDLYIEFLEQRIHELKKRLETLNP